MEILPPLLAGAPHPSVIISKTKTLTGAYYERFVALSQEYEEVLRQPQVLWWCIAVIINHKTRLIESEQSPSQTISAGF